MNTRLAPQFARLLALVLTASLGCASDPPKQRQHRRQRWQPAAPVAQVDRSSTAPSFGPPAGRVEDGPFTCTADAAAGAITFEKIGEWRDDAAAAYTIIHDDACGPELRGIDMVAVPALDMRNLKANLGPFVQVCEEAGLWDMVRTCRPRATRSSTTRTAIPTSGPPTPPRK